jgi:hypothetical protein
MAAVKRDGRIDIDPEAHHLVGHLLDLTELAHEGA